MLAQRRDLGLAPDEGRQRRHVRSLETARQPSHPRHAPDLQRPRDALQQVLAAVQAVEARLHQAMHPAADDDRVRLGDVLQPRRDDHRVAGRAAVVRLHDHEAAGDADAHRDVRQVGQLERGQPRDDVERRADGALGLVLVRHRVAEEGDDAVAQALEDVAFVARHAVGARLFVDVDDALQGFGVDAAGDLGEAHHVAEQHGQRAPLAGFACSGTDFGARGPGWRRHAGRRIVELGDGAHQPFAVTERNAELLEVCFFQQAQRRHVDVVVGKRLRVLFKALLL